MLLLVPSIGGLIYKIPYPAPQRHVGDASHIFIGARYVAHARLRNAGYVAAAHKEDEHHSFRATSGPVMRLMTGSVAAIRPSAPTIPTTTTRKYRRPGRRSDTSSWD